MSLYGRVVTIQATKLFEVEAGLYLTILEALRRIAKVRPRCANWSGLRKLSNPKRGSQSKRQVWSTAGWHWVRPTLGCRWSSVRDRYRTPVACATVRLFIMEARHLAEHERK